MSQERPVHFVGRAYGRPPAQPDDVLALAGPGTSGGELLRRYWQPIALSTDATNKPKAVKIMGEDLILFRDGEGKAGLLYPRCMHRGTSLLYGKVEANGIRCCYHGWLFDAEGNCLETPCEPTSNTKSLVRQPWYPVVEKFGLIFTYMGPPEKQPAFPRFSIEDGLAEDEYVFGYKNTTGPNGPHPKVGAKSDYNWVQNWDNFMDPFHVTVTHFLINGVQFTESLGILPEVKFEYTADGVRSIQHRILPNGSIHQRISQVIMPNMHCTPGVSDEDLGRSSIGWLVPIDDISFQHYLLFVGRKGSPVRESFLTVGMLSDDWGPKHGKPFSEWSLEDHQEWQTDYVAQKGQGDITLHSEEHLTSIDAGTSMMRRMFKKQAAAVKQGEDPVGASFAEPYFVRITAGNAMLDPTTKAAVAGYDGR